MEKNCVTSFESANRRVHFVCSIQRAIGCTKGVWTLLSTKHTRFMLSIMHCATLGISD